MAVICVLYDFQFHLSLMPGCTFDVVPDLTIYAIIAVIS